MIYDGTGSVEGETGWYLVVLGKHGASLFSLLSGCLLSLSWLVEHEVEDA